MGRFFALMVAVILGGLAIGGLALGITAERGGLGSDMAWAEPYVGTGGMVLGGLALAAAFLLIGLALGRWQHPRPVPDPRERHHHGVQG